MGWSDDLFYPVMINLENKNITVIGGGNVALRKITKLLEYNLKVKVVSPFFVDGFDLLKEKLEIITDEFKEEYIKDSFLVIAATSSKTVNNGILVYCNKKNILCNIVDNYKMSDFIIPSSIKRGSLVISVSTEGKSPSLSSNIIRQLENKYTEKYDCHVELLGQIRELVLRKCEDKNRRKTILNEIISLNIEELEKRRMYYENCSRI